jgi:hypothetical protein
MRKQVRQYNCDQNNPTEQITYSLLGELVHSLLRAGTTTLQHIEQSLLIRSQANDFADQITDHLGSLGQLLHMSTHKIDKLRQAHDNSVQ